MQEIDCMPIQKNVIIVTIVVKSLLEINYPKYILDQARKWNSNKKNVENFYWYHIYKGTKFMLNILTISPVSWFLPLNIST